MADRLPASVADLASWLLLKSDAGLPQRLHRSLRLGLALSTSHSVNQNFDPAGSGHIHQARRMTSVNMFHITHSDLQQLPPSVDTQILAAIGALHSSTHPIPRMSGHQWRF